MTEINIPPGNPFSPRQVRILKITVIVMTALLVIGIGALIVGIVREVRSREHPQQSSYMHTVTLGKGEVKAVFADRGLIVVHWKGDHGDLVLSFDPQSGREIGRIQLEGR
jgi:hypothetical protein